ncbi:hypothetical protein FRC16_007712 [Serendipita sp. 398]|nr:hypothetical protein FRC16_007712 [Serendipita sp. 398]
MTYSLFSSIFFAALNTITVVKAAQTVTVCSAGECLTGQSNITRLGAALNTQSNAYLLLPGQYTANVQPTALSQALTSATATLTFTTGFSNSSTATSPSLPLNVALQPGLLNYPSDLYTGDPSFIALPQSINSTFTPTNINRGSIILAANTVAALEANNNGAKSRVVLWDTVPFISQLPYTMAGNLQLVSLLSSSCSPPCSNNAVCSVGGSCICPTGFTGASCEECSPGFYGPQCTACPSGCSKCDEGINGDGSCLTPQLPANSPINCNLVFAIPALLDAPLVHTTFSVKPLCLPTSNAANACRDWFLQAANALNLAPMVLSIRTGFANLATPVVELNMFAINGTCKSCHPDCATCTGPGFNECSTCVDSSPIRTSNNRCVKTCAKSEYYDTSSSTCKTCDSTCGSCSAGGSSSCLSCNSPKQVLRAGTCTDVNCGNNQGPTSGLGVCLVELVQVPNNSGTPPATIPPLDPNAQQPSSGGGHKLLWWQILLIVIGALLILILILILWRRRARQKRAKETEQFKHNLKHQGLWGKLWRNPFSAWWARRRSAALARRSQDVERMSEAKDWKSNSSNTERRTAVGVPKSISRGSWVTMGQHTERRRSFDGRSYFTNNAGLGAIREYDRYDDRREKAREPSERSYGRSYKNGAPSSYSDGESRRYREPPRGESQYYGQEIEQEEVRSERTYDPYQYPRPPSRGFDDRHDLVSMIKSEYTEGDRYDDRMYNHSRSNTRDDRSYQQDYPQSVTTRRTQSRYQYQDTRPYGRGMRGESPSVYSQSTGAPPAHLRQQLPPISFPDQELPVRDAVLSSRFSMSTTAASTRPPTKNSRNSPPTEPVPQLTEPPRQLTDAEMYKMSKLFPELLKLVSPTKKEHSPAQTTTSPSRNPFRTFI